MPEQGVTSHKATASRLPMRGKIFVRYETRYNDGWQFCEAAYVMDMEIPVPLPGSPAE